MASIAHCDTHTVLWLYAGEINRFSAKAAEAIESFDLCVSPMVRLEIQYLNEIGRIQDSPEKIFKVLTADFGIQLCIQPFIAVVKIAETMHWTRDPFDRLITAQAKISDAPLITRDEIIRKHYKQCIW